MATKGNPQRAKATGKEQDKPGSARTQISGCAYAAWQWLRKVGPMNTLTFFLVVLTFFYLRETTKQRRLLEETVSVNTRPKVFIKTLDSEAKADFPNSQVVIHTTLSLSNCSRVEGKNIRFSYTISENGEERKCSTVGPFGYLYPEQVAGFKLEKLSFKLSKEEMKAVKQAIEEDKFFRAPWHEKRVILLNLTLTYEDEKGESLQLLLV